MATEKDIRQFFEQNRPPVSDGSDKFMEEFIRQVDLLPTPARLQKPDEDKLRTVLKRFEKKRRRSDIITVVSSLLTAAAVCLILAAVVLLAPETLSALPLFPVLMSYPCFSFALLFTATTLLSCHRSGLFNI